MRRFLATAGNGHLGRLGHAFPCASELLLRVVPSLLGHEVRQVACGGAHTAVVTDDGSVFTFGLNAHGQLGHSREDPFVAVPLEVGIPEAVKAVAAGDHHTLCLTESGDVWAFGSGGAGQLGIGQTVFDRPELPPTERFRQVEPRIIKALQGAQVVALATGSSHSLALTEGGEVYSWGHAPHGALGHGAGTQRIAQWTPRRVVALRDVLVRHISAGPASSGALDGGGSALTWGHGGNWALGLGSSDDQYAPSPLPEPIPWLRSLSLGLQHSTAVARDGRVLVWGTDEHGSLGAGDGVLLRHPIRTPEVRALPLCSQAAAGWKHSAAVTREGKLMTWGWAGAYTSGWMTDGGSGQLCQGDDLDRWGPSAVLRLRTGATRYWDQRVAGVPHWRVLQVALGRNHTAAVIEGPLTVADLQ